MASLAHIRRFVTGHWKGENSLLLTTLVSLLGLSVLFASLITLLLPPSTLLIAMACATGAGLIIWQTVGTFRSAENHTKESSDLLPVWMSYGALLFGTLYSLSAMIGQVVGNYAPEPYVAPVAQHVTATGRTIRIDGPVTLLVHSSVKGMISDNDAFNAIELRSDGGSIHAARGLAKTIREHELDTTAIGPCRSACTLVFIAGKNRTLTQEGSLGFHSYHIELPSYAGGNDPTEEEDKDALFFKSRGVSEDFINKMFKTPHDKIWTPTRDELREAGLITALPNQN